MKCVLALSFFLAVASASGIHGVGVVATGHVVSTPTASQYHSQDELGQYAYGYAGPLSSKHEARSFDGVTRGGYSYVDGHGLVQSAEYVSDPHNGFRVAATNLPVGPGVPAPAIKAAPPAVVAAPVAHAIAAPVAAAVAAPVAVEPVLRAAIAPSVIAAPGVTSHSSVVTADGIVSHASVGPAVSHSTVVTHHGTSVIAPLAHSLAHPIAHSLVHPYALPYIHRRRRSIVALGHTPASTAPLGVAVAPAVHAYSAVAAVPAVAPVPAFHAVPAVHSVSAVHAVPALHAVPAVHAVHAVPAVAAVPAAASSRYHAQDELGQYSYGYNDGVSAKQEVRTHDGVTRGAYSYVDPRGVLQSVHYAADGHGFRAAASNIL